MQHNAVSKLVPEKVLCPFNMIADQNWVQLNAPSFIENIVDPLTLNKD